MPLPDVVGLRAAMQHPNQAMRNQAVGAASRMKVSEDIIPDILKVFRDAARFQEGHASTLRYNCVTAIVRIGGRDVARTISPLLDPLPEHDLEYLGADLRSFGPDVFIDIVRDPSRPESLRRKASDWLVDKNDWAARRTMRARTKRVMNGGSIRLGREQRAPGKEPWRLGRARCRVAHAVAFAEPRGERTESHTIAVAGSRDPTPPACPYQHALTCYSGVLIPFPSPPRTLTCGFGVQTVPVIARVGASKTAE